MSIRLSGLVFFTFKRRAISDIILVADFEKFGGTRTYLCTLLRFYAQLSKSVTVLVRENFHDNAMREYVQKLGFSYHVLVNRLPPWLHKRQHIAAFRLLAEIHQVWPFFWRIRPDLVVVSTAGYFDLLGSIVLPTRFLYILHSYPRECLESYYVRLLKNMLGRYRRLLTVSHYSKNRILDYWQLNHYSNHINVIYNSLLLSEGVPEEKKDGKEITVLTLGHVVTYKNPDYWIQIATQVIKSNPDKEIRFIWAGDGELLEKCRDKVAAIGLEEISFIGYTIAVDKLYLNADIYFQPSILESFGLSVIHAMYYSIPCVVSNTGGLTEIVDDNVTGYLIDINLIDETVRKISSLINQPELRAQMGAAGSQRFYDMFSFDRWVREMSALHQAMLL